MSSNKPLSDGYSSGNGPASSNGITSSNGTTFRNGDTLSNDKAIMIGFHKRRDRLTEEQFHQYWEMIYALVLAPWAVKYGVISYAQVHMTSELHDQWTRNTGRNKGPPDLDGASIFEIKTLEQFLPEIGDLHYNDIILKHDLQCDDFRETTISMGTVGWKKDIIVGGMARVDSYESDRLLREMNDGSPDSP